MAQPCVNGRLAIVSFNVHQPFSPRGERTRALAEGLQTRWAVEVIGPPPSEGTDANVGRRRAASLRRRARALTDSFLLDKYEPWSKRKFRRWRPSVEAALLIGYPFSPVSEAARRLAVENVPYVVDSGDPWVLTDSGGPNRFIGRWRSRRAERQLWQRAAGAVVTTPGQARDLSALFPELPILVRPNGYQPVTGQTPTAATSTRGETNRRLRLVHFGNLYAARIDVAAFLKTLRATGPWNQISFDLYGSDWTGMLAHLPAGVAAVHHDPLPWPDVVRRASDYDLAVVMGNRNPAQLPSKAVQYLTLPIPRLAAVGNSRNEALAEYVRDKPGWLAVAAAEPDAGERVAGHLARPWPAAQLRPPVGESWSAVVEQIAGFLECCLDSDRVARKEAGSVHAARETASSTAPAS